MGEIVKETEIQWMKPGASITVSILGKDIAVVASKNMINFIEISRPEKKELLYHANSEVRGDGVQCICTHKTLPCFAFAEMCRNPRILVVSYPSFEVFKSFDSVTDTNYIALKFSEMEYLVALTGVPDYKIVIWNWRTAEKVHVQETKLRNPNQFLSISPTSPIQIVQSTNTDREIFFWNMSVCYKKILFNKVHQSLPETSTPPYCFCFGADGELYFVDSEGSLYMVNADTKSVVLQLSCQSPKKDNYVPCLVWYKGGLVLSTPSKVQFWRRKSPEGWALIWTYETKTPFAKLLSSSLRDHLLGVTIWNDVMLFKGETQIDCVLIREYAGDFEFINFIHPVGDYFITFGNTRRLFTIWNKIQGQMTSSLAWSKKRINSMKSNPKRPYSVVVTEDGRTNIINTYDPNYIMELDEVPLTRNSLHEIRFANQGILFCVANREIGEFFMLRLPAKIDVVAYLKIDLKIVDYALNETDDNKLNLLIVPMSQMCCRSGHNLMIYAYIDKLKVFEYVKDIVMPWVTTCIAPSTVSSDLLFCVPHRSRQVDLLNINTGKVMEKA
ncbi:hypothetical protein RUM43_007868 [Polyplax serrata]|uniref:Uncharacterized protein n=1 Tax=Polyplax serrata TaxID=468196 RepID=A0AAN8P6A7_POLSC